MGRMVRNDYMRMIYTYCVRVYLHEITVKQACFELKGKTQSTEASLKMYFHIYACMRKGVCYKMGTSATFTRFLIEQIYKDNGEDAFILALAAARQNADYRISCSNEQPGIEAVCRELIAEKKLSITYEDLCLYYGKKNESNVVATPHDCPDYSFSMDCSGETIIINVTYGDMSFQINGNLQTAVTKLNSFSEKVMPQIVDSIIKFNSLHVQSDPSVLPSSNSMINSSCDNKSVGQQLIESGIIPASLSSKKDFKARMIPLLFFAEELNLQKDFSIKEIQTIMKDAIGEDVQKKDIEDVFSRRSHWFEKTSNNPRRYKLLDIAKDYSRNIIM